MNPSQKPKQTKHRCAGVFLVTSDGRVLGQHRDDKLGIDHPNKIGPFGGAMEKGETPLQTAWRELVQEETNVRLKHKRQLIPLSQYIAWRDLTKEWETLYFFYAIISEAMLDKLEIYEGQGWQYILSPSQPEIVEPARPALVKLFGILNTQTK